MSDWWQLLGRWRERRHAAHHLRAELEAWGFPLAELSDQELIDGVTRILVQATLFGCSTEEAAQALTPAARKRSGANAGDPHGHPAP